jgi:hypothetical protein
VPVLGVGLSRKDMHEPEALLTARGEVIVGDPLDPSPFVNDGSMSLVSVIIHSSIGNLLAGQSL